MLSRKSRILQSVHLPQSRTELCERIHGEKLMIATVAAEIVCYHAEISVQKCLVDDRKDLALKGRLNKSSSSHQKCLTAVSTSFTQPWKHLQGFSEDDSFATAYNFLHFSSPYLYHQPSSCYVDVYRHSDCCSGGSATIFQSEFPAADISITFDTALTYHAVHVDQPLKKSLHRSMARCSLSINHMD